MPAKRPRSPTPAKNDVDALLIGVSKRLKAIAGSEDDETGAPDIPSPVTQLNPGVPEPGHADIRTVGSIRLTPEQIARVLDERVTSEQKSILKLLTLYFALSSTGRIPEGTIDFSPLCRSINAALSHLNPRATSNPNPPADQVPGPNLVTPPNPSVRSELILDQNVVRPMQPSSAVPVNDAQNPGPFAHPVFAPPPIGAVNTVVPRNPASSQLVHGPPVPGIQPPLWEPNFFGYNSANSHYTGAVPFYLNPTVVFGPQRGAGLPDADPPVVGNTFPSLRLGPNIQQSMALGSPVGHDSAQVGYDNGLPVHSKYPFVGIPGAGLFTSNGLRLKVSCTYSYLGNLINITHVRHGQDAGLHELHVSHEPWIRISFHTFGFEIFQVEQEEGMALDIHRAVLPALVDDPNIDPASYLVIQERVREPESGLGIDEMAIQIHARGGGRFDIGIDVENELLFPAYATRGYLEVHGPEARIVNHGE